jgi:hypothetical protein
MVKPNKCIAQNVGMIDNGNATAATKVARRSRRNSYNHRQDGALEQQQHRAAVIFLHRINKIECFSNRDLGMRCLQFIEFMANTGGHIHFARATRSGDFKTDYRLAIEQRRRTPFGGCIADRGNLIETDMAAVGQHDFHARQLFRRLHGGNGTHRLLGTTHIGAATRSFLLSLAQLARNFGCRGVECLQSRRVNFHPHLARYSSHARHRSHPSHTEQQLGYGIVHEPAQRLIIHAAGSHRVSKDGRARQFHLGNHGVTQIAGQIGAHARHRIAHIIYCLLSGFLQPEFSCNNGRTILHLGVDMLDALQRGDRIFQLARYFGFQLRGRRARQRGGDRHRGQVNVGEILYFHRAETHQAEQREHDE